MDASNILIEGVREPVVDPEETPDVMFNADHQANLYLIEEALRKVGAQKKPEKDSPKLYDEQLRRLIDAVPIE